MLRVKKNDRVRIHLQGIVAEGPVRSAYDTMVYDDDGDVLLLHPDDDAGPRSAVLIGYEPEGIEMSDEKSLSPNTGLSGAYRYWKRGDGGHVYLLKPDGEWAQVFPHQLDGTTKYDGEFEYKGYKIVTSREIYNGMWDVVWYPLDDATQVMRRGGFFSGKGAIGYAKGSIIEHLYDLKMLEVRKHDRNRCD